MKIDIKIDDEKLFTDVALVVDQYGFAEEIEKARKKLKFDFPLSPSHKREPLTEKQKKQINEAVEQIRKKLRLPHIFIKVILGVLLYGMVEKDDYAPAILTEENQYFDDMAYEPDYKYSILLSPQARDEDVIKALQDYRDKVQNFLKQKPGYQFIPVLSSDIVQGKPSIKHHRDWYLKTSKGITVEDICQEYANKCSIPQPHETGKNKPKGCICFDESTVRYGIRNYKTLLRKSRTF